MANGNYARIVKFLEHISANKPKMFPKFFYLKSELVCIINADKMFDLPIKLAKYQHYDEFYLQFNANDKTVFFYAFDIREYTTGELCNEQTGTIDWEDIESSFLRFLSMHLQELSSSTNPFTDVAATTDKSCPVVSGGDAARDVSKRYLGPTQRYEHSHSHGYGPHGTPYSGGNNSSYNPDTYKIRSAFTDKLDSYLKEYKTAAATDFIVASMGKFVEEKNYDVIDSVFRFAYTDKMNILAMKTLLTSTSGCDKSKGREEFLGKFKVHLNKLKPTMAEGILKGI